jgi:hypothetical protein
MACQPHDQFGVGLRADAPRQTLYIAVWSTATDPIFQSRARIMLWQIPPRSATPDLPVAHVIPPASMMCTRMPQAVADTIWTIGIAVRNGRVPLHYTSNHVQGVYNGVNGPEPNNHLSRVDE